MTMELQEIVKAWVGKERPTSVSEYSAQLGDFVIDFLYHTMRISDPAVDRINVKSVMETYSLTNFTGPVTTAYALKNNIDIVPQFLNSLVARKPIDENLIRSFNKLITKNSLDARKYSGGQERPGEWRKHMYTHGCAVEAIPRKMGELAAFMSQTGDEIFKIATISHCVFESIHPFAKGNGRTGRLLMNYYLMLHDYPPLIVYSDESEQYFDCIRQFEENPKKISKMHHFLQEQLIRTWSTRFSAVDTNEYSCMSLLDEV